MADYDKYYKTEDLFGEPYPELIDFFKYMSQQTDRDRDSISLAKLGYNVTGIDNSKVGIDQMISISEQEGLKLTGLVGDIYVFDKYQDFDIVLLDSLLHFEKRELKRETGPD